VKDLGRGEGEEVLGQNRGGMGDKNGLEGDLEARSDRTAFEVLSKE